MEKAVLFGLNFSDLKKEINELPDNVTENAPRILGSAITNLMIEDYDNVGAHTATFTELAKHLGENILLMHHDDFTDACSDYNLPVIARNNLENGESKNLWYEQIVPHQSRFVFYIRQALEPIIFLVI
jgi:CRISPR-associated protein Cmr4